MIDQWDWIAHSPSPLLPQNNSQNYRGTLIEQLVKYYNKTIHHNVPPSKVGHMQLQHYPWVHLAC